MENPCMTMHALYAPLLFASAPHVSSLNFTLHQAKQKKLTFTWINVLGGCPATNYKIISRNCGQCPRTVNSSSVTCNNFSMTQRSTCTFTIQSVVCGNILGETADPIAVIVNSNSAIYFTLGH